MTNHKSHHIFIYLGLLIGIFILFFGFNYFKSLYNFNEATVVVSDQDYNNGVLTESPFVPVEEEVVGVDPFEGEIEYPELPITPFTIKSCEKFISEYTCQEGDKLPLIEGRRDCNLIYSRSKLRCDSFLDGEQDPYGDFYGYDIENLKEVEDGIYTVKFLDFSVEEEGMYVFIHYLEYPSNEEVEHNYKENPTDFGYKFSLRSVGNKISKVKLNKDLVVRGHDPVQNKHVEHDLSKLEYNNYFSRGTKEIPSVYYGVFSNQPYKVSIIILDKEITEIIEVAHLP